MLLATLPWLLSALTLWMMVLAGQQHKKTWLLSLFNQLLWIVFTVHSQAWGLLPLAFCMIILSIHNHRKWNK